MKLQLLFFVFSLIFQQHGISADIFSILGIKKTIQIQMITTIVDAQIDIRLKKILEVVPNKTCAAHLKDYVHGLRNLNIWAIKMFDASTKIPQSLLEGVETNLGNWHECIKVRDVHTQHGSFSAQHCLVRVCSSELDSCPETMRDATSFAADIQKQIKSAGGIANVGNIELDLDAMEEQSILRLSLCLPSTCSAHDLELAFNQGLKQLTKRMQINVVDHECQSPEGKPLNFVDNITIIFLIAVFTLVSCCTIYDVVYQDSAERKELYITFSAYTNMRRITEMYSDPNSLQCLHGVRAISILWVICGQRYYSDAKMPLINKSDIVDFVGSAYNLGITLMPLCVDTFLVLSGLLLSYGFLNNVSGRNSFDAKQFYKHRYIRLVPALAVMVLLQSSLLTKIGDGPMWGMKQNVDCDRTWWHSLLFIKNYQMPSTCAQETWYVALDTQLYILSPLLLMPLWKNPRRGRQLLAAALGLSWLVPFIQSYSQYIILPCQFIAPGDEFDKAMKNMVYPTHNRATPWLIGLWFGYLLHRMKVGQYKLRLNKVVVAAVWTVAALLLFICATSIHNCYQLDTEYSRLQQAFVNASGHFFWGMGIALAIYACLTGHGGPINSFLSMEMWQPISRLSYSMYLVHGAVQLYDTASTKSLGYFAHISQFPKFTADVVLCLMAATMLALMFELPALALEKYFKGDKTDYSTTNKVLVAESEKYQHLNNKEKEKIRP